MWVEVDHVLDDDSCSQAVQVGDSPAHLGAALLTARRDENHLNDTRAGVDEFLDLERRGLERVGELADI